MNLIQRIALALNINNYEYIKREIEKSHHTKKDSIYVTELIDKMNPSLIDLELMKLAIDKGYKFNWNMPKEILNNGDIVLYLLENSDNVKFIIDHANSSIITLDLVKKYIAEGKYYVDSDTPKELLNNMELIQFALLHRNGIGRINDILNIVDKSFLSDEIFMKIFNNGYKLNYETPEFIKLNPKYLAYNFVNYELDDNSLQYEDILDGLKQYFESVSSDNENADEKFNSLNSNELQKYIDQFVYEAIDNKFQSILDDMRGLIKSNLIKNNKNYIEYIIQCLQKNNEKLDLLKDIFTNVNSSIINIDFIKELIDTGLSYDYIPDIYKNNEDIISEYLSKGKFYVFNYIKDKNKEELDKILYLAIDKGMYFNIDNFDNNSKSLENYITNNPDICIYSAEKGNLKALDLINFNNNHEISFDRVDKLIYSLIDSGRKDLFVYDSPNIIRNNKTYFTYLLNKIDNPLDIQNIIDNMYMKTLFDENIYKIIIDKGYKFNEKTPDIMEKNIYAVLYAMSKGDQFAFNLFKEFKQEINPYKLDKIKDVLSNNSIDELNNILKDNTLIDDNLIKLMIDLGYNFSSNTSDYIKMSPELIEYAIKKSSNNLLDKIVDNVLWEDMDKTTFLSLSKMLIKSGYRFNENTPEIFKSSVDLIWYILNTPEVYTYSDDDLDDFFDDFAGENKTSNFIDMYINNFNWNKINAEEGLQLFKLAIQNGYIFDETAPDSIKNNPSFIKVIMDNTTDINNVIVNVNPSVFSVDYISQLIIDKIELIEFGLFLKIKDKLNPQYITDEINQTCENANEILNKYGKINTLDTNECFTYELIKYIYPVFGDNFCISLLKYNSGADIQIIEQIKRNNTELIKFYYHKIVPSLFDVSDDKTVHYSFRYFKQFERLINDIFKNNIELTEEELYNLKNIVYTGNKYNINTINELKNYNYIINEKLENMMKSDDIITIKDFLANSFGFYSRMQKRTVYKDMMISSFANLKLTFNSFQLDNFSKLNYIYESIKKSKIIPKELLNKLMLNDDEIKLIILMKNIIETSNIDELKNIVENMKKENNEILDYSVNISEIIAKIRTLYNIQYQTKLTKIKDLDKSKSEKKYKTIRKYKNHDDSEGYLEEVAYEIIDMDSQDFHFLAHRIYHFDPRLKDFCEMLMNNPSLWTKLDGASTLSTSSISNKGFRMLKPEDNSGVIYLFNNLTPNFMLFMYGRDLVVEHGGHKLEPTSRANWFSDIDGLNQSSLYHDRNWNEVAGFRKDMMPCAIACVGEEPNDDQIRAANYFNIPIIRFNIKAYKDICINNFKKVYESFREDSSFENLESIFFSGDIGDTDIEIDKKFDYCFDILKGKLSKNEINANEFLSKLSYIQQLIDRICDNKNKHRNLVRKIELYKKSFATLAHISEEQMISLENANMGESGVMFKYNESGTEYLLKPAVDKEKMQTQNFRAEIQKSASVLQEIISSDTSVSVDIIGDRKQKISRQEKLKLSKNSNQLEDWVNNKTTLDPKIANQLLQEYVVDFLLCNFDCFAGNFVIDSNHNLRGIDKEQSFRFIDECESLKPDFSYIPNGNKRIPIYKILFEKYNSGEIDLDFSYFDEAIRKAESITDQEYREIFRKYTSDLNPYKTEEILDKIVKRKHDATILMKEYIESIRNMHKESGGIKL